MRDPGVNPQSYDLARGADGDIRIVPVKLYGVMAQDPFLFSLSAESHSRHCR
jgi:hypothetical protein